MLTSFDLDSTTCFATILAGQPALPVKLTLTVGSTRPAHRESAPTSAG